MGRLFERKSSDDPPSNHAQRAARKLSGFKSPRQDPGTWPRDQLTHSTFRPIELHAQQRAPPPVMVRFMVGTSPAMVCSWKTTSTSPTQHRASVLESLQPSGARKKIGRLLIHSAPSPESGRRPRRHAALRMFIRIDDAGAVVFRFSRC